MKKILVIDGNNIINRAFYGVRPLLTKSGKNTNAVFGTVSIITKQLEAIKPDYAAVAFDLKEPTFRHKMYGAYKAGRRPSPPELHEQFPYVKECLSLMGIHVLELPGWEADDIQGTVARLAHSEEDTESYILSGDRDLLQLIDDKTTVLLVTNKDTIPMHSAEFKDKYGILPDSFVDMKALMGDSSDNIPGVAGIGEKTAASLIQNFGSLDGIYESIDDPKIAKGVREKLIRDKENAYLSRTLAKIDTEAPISIGLSDIKYKGFNVGGLYAKFSELELNSFITKFKLTPDKATEDKKSGNQIGFFDTASEAPEESAAGIREADAEELNGLSGERIALVLSDGIPYIYNSNVGKVKYSGELSRISSMFSGSELITFDAKALWHKLDRAGVSLEKTKLRDLSVYAYVLNPGSGTGSCSTLVSMFLGKTVSRDAPHPELLLELEKAMLKKIREDGLEKILEELELPLISILAETEKAGFMINRDEMLEFADALSALISELTEKIYAEAGEKFNINSPKQLGEILFVKLGLPAKKKKTKTGFSTDVETLEELRAEHPIIDDILEYRQVSKLHGTYASALPNVADENGRIHTEFKQTLTATGRLSSADPNLQNIPIKTKMGREMRRCFVAKEGYSLVDADYSQIELRLLAHVSGDYNMSEAFKAGEDIHRKTASAVFGIPEEYVTEDMRKKAKAVNFGIVYGISGFSLAKDIGTTTQEATKYIKNYLYNYPSIDKYLEVVVNEATENGYTVTPMGRRRYIPELKSSNGNLRAFGKRVAMNAPIQGAAADIMKLAMINVDKALKASGIDARIVMQVHDELVVEVLDRDIEKCMATVRAEMESAAVLSVPLTVDVTVGKNWLEQE